LKYGATVQPLTAVKDVRGADDVTVDGTCVDMTVADMTVVDTNVVGMTTVEISVVGISVVARTDVELLDGGRTSIAYSLTVTHEAPRASFLAGVKTFKIPPHDAIMLAPDGGISKLILHWPSIVTT
jgi:hypothetical protein